MVAASGTARRGIGEVLPGETTATSRRVIRSAESVPSPNTCCPTRRFDGTVIAHIPSRSDPRGARRANLIKNGRGPVVPQALRKPGADFVASLGEPSMVPATESVPSNDVTRACSISFVPMINPAAPMGTLHPPWSAWRSARSARTPAVVASSSIVATTSRPRSSSSLI